MASKLTENQTAALQFIIKAAAPVVHKSDDHPNNPHHKTLEGLHKRGLIEKHASGGFLATAAGRSAVTQ